MGRTKRLPYYWNLELSSSGPSTKKESNLKEFYVDKPAVVKNLRTLETKIFYKTKSLQNKKSTYYTVQNTFQCSHWTLFEIQFLQKNHGQIKVIDSLAEEKHFSWPKSLKKEDKLPEKCEQKSFLEAVQKQMDEEEVLEIVFEKEIHKQEGEKNCGLFCLSWLVAKTL